MKQSIQHIKNEFTTTEAKVIAVSSRFHAQTPSSIALNLSICLASRGQRVCVFDANKNQLEHSLLPETRKILTLQDMLNGDIEIDELVHTGPGSIKMIPPSTGIGEYLSLGDREMQNLLSAFTQLQYEFDYVLMDTAAGIDESTISYLLGPGSIFITVTPDATSLNAAFSLLKSVKQRVFQQPVKVVVNLVAGEQEAKQIIARLSVAVRKFLGSQCGGLSFFIIDDHMLNIMSQTRLVMLEYPDSLPGKCLQDMASRLVESELDKDLEVDEHLDLDDEYTGLSLESRPRWLDEALFAISNEPVELIQPIMQKLNEIWQKRSRLSVDNPSRPNAFDLEILKLKTAIHFAQHVNDQVKENPK